MTLLEVADLSTVWIEAEVYEKDIPFLQEGQTDRSHGRVAARPDVRRQSVVGLSAGGNGHADRRRAVRGGQPRRRASPGMFATVRISTPDEPRTSPQESGTRP